jgi:hypothetical protein
MKVATPKSFEMIQEENLHFQVLAKFLKNKNIYQHFALNSIGKANYAERVILI